MANANKQRTQDIDYSASTGYDVSMFLGYGGIWSSPTGTLPAFQNTIFVAKNGDDSTALTQFTAAGNKGVLAYPFLTLAAARSAAVSLTPSSTNRVRIIVFSGRYLEQLVLANCVDWDLTDSVIDLQTGAAYTIDDNNVSCDSLIQGQAIIRRSTAGTLGAIRTQNSGTNLRLFCNNIDATQGHGIVCTNGVQFIRSTTINVSTSASYGAVCSAGRQQIETSFETCTNGLNCTGGIQISKGNFQTITTYAAVCSGGTQYIYGNSTSIPTVASCSGGTQYLYGNHSCTTTTSAILCSSTGNQYYYGNLTTSGTISDGAAYNSGSGLQYILGNITMTGTGNALNNGSSGNQTFYGDIVSLNRVAFNQSSGTQRIYGNSTVSAATSTTSICLSNGTGSQIIQGDLTIVTSGTGSGLRRSSGAGFQSFVGNLTMTGGTAFKAITCAAGNQVIDGIIQSDVTKVIEAQGGTIRVRARVWTSGTDCDAVSQTSGTLILDGATLVATGTGKSISDSSAATIYSPSCANKDVGTSVTLSNGPLTISASIT